MAAETRALLAKGVPQGTAGKPSVFREQLWVNDYLSAPSCPWYMEVHKSAAVTIGGREVVAVWLHERLKLVLLVLYLLRLAAAAVTMVVIVWASGGFSSDGTPPSGIGPLILVAMALACLWAGTCLVAWHLIPGGITAKFGETRKAWCMLVFIAAPGLGEAIMLMDFINLCCERMTFGRQVILLFAESSSEPGKNVSLAWVANNTAARQTALYETLWVWLTLPESSSGKALLGEWSQTSVFHALSKARDMVKSVGSSSSQPPVQIVQQITLTCTQVHA